MSQQGTDRRGKNARGLTADQSGKKKGDPEYLNGNRKRTKEEGFKEGSQL